MLALGRLRVSSGSALVTELKPRVHVSREKEEGGESCVSVPVRAVEETPQKC